MGNLLLLFLGLFFLGLAVFYGACFLRSLWTGCSIEEAATWVQNCVGNKTVYQFENDNSFAEKIWENVQETIGDAKYQKLCNLSKTAITTPLLWFGMEAGIPYIGICVPYKDNAEKLVLENLLVDVVIEYLDSSGYYTEVETAWHLRYDLQIPYIKIKYSRTEREHSLLLKELKRKQIKILLPEQPVTDDEEAEDLS